MSLVLLPAGGVSVPNATAYVVSIGDVKADWSRAEIAFDVPKTPHPIVIYGMKQLNLPDLEYNSIHDCSSLTVDLKTGDVLKHHVRKGALVSLRFIDKVQLHCSSFSSPSGAKR